MFYKETNIKIEGLPIKEHPWVKDGLLYFMCLFLEILWVKKYRNSSVGKYFPITKNIFSMPKNLELLFLRSLV